MNDIKGFTFFKSFVEALEKLKYEDSKKEVVLAIVYYVYYNKEPCWSNKERDKKELIWTLIEPTLTSSKNRSGNAKKG